MSFDRDGEHFCTHLTIDRDSEILTIRLSTDEETNHSTIGVLNDLAECLEKIVVDPEVRVIIISMTPNGFDFGSDVAELGGLEGEQAEKVSQLCSKVYGLLSSTDKVTIAAIYGECFGIGLEIALHCDMRVGREGARFGFTGMNFGLVPNGAAVRRLTRLVGESHARMMSLTGAVISADRAFVIGFITNVLEAENFESGVSLLSNHMARMSPIAVTETKKILDIAYQDRVDSLSNWSARALARCVTEDDVADRVDAVLDLEHANATIH